MKSWIQDANDGGRGRFLAAGSMAALALGLVAAAVMAAPSHAAPPVATAATEVPVGKDWIALPADNICGLRDLNQLSNPAQVDYEAVLAATPEMKKLKEDKIDPSSPDGIRLTSAAADRVTRACETARLKAGHCSVWKQIRHRDGRSVADISEQVRAQL